jgi:HD-like signal output (HDOD) protein
MKRVLFVDDETAVLDGLRDRLRKQRREWEMVFAHGGDAALSECARGEFDVVVSDMRMPGMDGAELLKRIKEAYPSTIRIVLSGHAERQAVMRALPVAHQYLSKPCDAEVLRGVIARALKLQTLMNNEPLRRLVGRVERLPSVSSVYVGLTAVLARDSPSIDDVVAVVERDPAMCLKLLQVVNSAFFGLSRRVSAMRDAIAYLGIELVKSLVLAAQIFSAAEGAWQLDARWLETIQLHSTLVARVARAVAPPAVAADAFMAGMLHDIGQVLLAFVDDEWLSCVPESALRRGLPCHVVERERLGVTHAEAGAYILGTWGLPFPIVEAVAGHHEPALLGVSSLDTTLAVHIAEGLVTESDRDAPKGATSLDLESLQRLDLHRELDSWRALVARLRTGRE